MKCKHCKKVIEDDAVWCRECGTETGVVAERYSAAGTLREDWTTLRSTRSYPFAIFYVLAILAPITVAAILTGHHYWLNNLVMLPLVPFALIPFAIPLGNGRITIGDFTSHLRTYPRYLALTLIAEVYFFALKVICTGKPLFFFAADPILHLVRLVMVLYGLTIILPALSLLEMGVGRALWTAYKGGADTRWQQFFILFLLALLNVVAAIPVGLGLLITVPFSFYTIRRYTERLSRFTSFKRYLSLESGSVN
jgi:hypothetical protein